MGIDELIDGGADNAGGVIAAVDLAENQSAFDQSGVAVGECLGGICFGAGGFGEVAKMIARSALVGGGGLMNRVMGTGEFSGGVHEHAAVKFGIVEPEIHHIEHGPELPERIIAGEFMYGAAPGLGFPFIAPLHGGDHQVVFAFEMFVEGRLGHAGG